MLAERLVVYMSFFVYCVIYDTKLLQIYLALWCGIGLFHIFSPWTLNSLRKRATIATWDEPREGIIHQRYEVDATNIKAYIKECREKLGIKVSLTHVVVKAIGELLKASPDINGKIVFGKYIPYESADVSVVVDVGDGRDLHGFLVENVDKLTVEDIAEFFESQVSTIKKSQDPTYVLRTKLMQYLPSFIMAFSLEITNILVHLGFQSKALGIRKNAGGGAGISNVGIFGVQDGTAPLIPFGSIPTAVTINRITDRPVVKEGKIQIAPVFNLNFSIDHRFMDGSKAKATGHILHTYLQNPWKGSRLGERKVAPTDEAVMGA